MPLRKGSDGKIVEEPARKAEIGRGDAGPTVKPGAPTEGDRRVIGSDNQDASPRAQDALDERTQLARFNSGSSSGSGSSSRSVPGRPAADSGAVRANNVTGQARGGAPDRTQLYGVEPPAADGEGVAQICEDPVVGWLVVEQGPGRGFFLPIGMGMNSVGRGSDQRLRLDFGDRAISKSKHFFVSFDPRSRKFGVHRGDGANLTYLNGAPVYGSEPLESFAQIEAGSTRLRFVALCGDQFDWSE